MPFVVIVFSLGRWHVGDARFNKVHHRVGLALLILALLQSIYGWLIHIKTLKKWFPRTGPRSIARYLHPIAGVSQPRAQSQHVLTMQIAIMVIGFVEVYLGLKLWKRPGHVPHGAYVAWGVLLAFWLALYLTGFVLLPRQWRAGKADLDVHGEIAGREKPQDGGHERLGSTDTQAAVA